MNKNSLKYKNSSILEVYMNSNEFLLKALKEPGCPNNFDQMYSKFQVYQNATIETLKEFHRVCEKNKIPYQLAYGSLLGAIRDNGQIPWDYDADVFVPYKYKDSLIEVLKKDLSKKYYFNYPEINPRCQHSIFRIAPIKYKTNFLQVDVFWMVGAPENEFERKKMAKELAFLYDFIYIKRIGIKENSYGGLRKATKLFFKKFYHILTPLAEKEKRFRELCSKYDIEESKYCIQVSRGSGLYLFETKKCWDTFLINTDIGELRISHDYENMLNQFYKKNLSYPAIIKCINEIVWQYKRFKYFEDYVK